MVTTPESIHATHRDSKPNHAVNVDSQIINALFDFPRLRENLWHIQPESPHSFVQTLGRAHEVTTADALSLMRIRSHCTGYNSLAEIEKRSGVPAPDVLSIIIALTEAGIAQPAKQSSGQGFESLEETQERLQRISTLWGRELSREFVANELLDNDLPKTVLVGWLLEMYHYVRDFPHAIECGARLASGALRDVLDRYVAEATGHESCVLQTLLNLGLSEPEVRESRPLVSTRLIGFLLRELFELEPASVSLLAAMVEAQGLPAARLDEFQSTIASRYGLPEKALAPYFQRKMINAPLRHSQLLAESIALFQVTDVAILNQIVDKLHDLKHALALQSKEIKMYYGDLAGKYFPCQAATFTGL